ncbi:MAG TPA: ATP-binding protein [Myxococcaceae bacterium]|nr:ATP-binding protein [Myxococcaceae bacterium]
MPADDRTPPRTLAGLLREHREELLQEWARRHAERLPGKRLTREARRDDLPELLDELAEAADTLSSEGQDGEPQEDRIYREAQESRAFFQAMLQGATFHIIGCHPDGTIRFFNAAAERMLGWRAEEVVGRAKPTLFHDKEETAARAAELTRELGYPVSADFEAYVARARLGQPDAREWTYVRRDGSRFPVYLVVTAVRDETGELLGFMGLAEDITERKRLEAESRARSEFEQQLIGIVSHDLRNPLNAILLGAQALLRRDGLEARQTVALTRIVSSAERATRMTRDLLDFTQARMGGGIPVRLAPVELHALTRQVVEEVRLSYPEREVRLEQEGEDEGQWDGDRMAQVLTNLLTNAFKYSPAGTPVTVRTRGDEGQVWLEVHNTGPPIAPEVQARIFEPLKRATRTAGREEERSLGLGLYIVRHIVQAHGGTVTVRSTAEEGTTFTVCLPRRPQAA